MGIGIARWRGEGPKAAIERVPAIFAERTGLSLDLEWLEPTRYDEPGAETCIFSVLSLHQRSFLSLAVVERGPQPEWNVEGEFDIPAHPYLWHHLQACLAVVNLHAVRVHSAWPLLDQQVSERWDHQWADLPLLRRLACSRPWLWPIWRA